MRNRLIRALALCSISLIFILGVPVTFAASVPPYIVPGSDCLTVTANIQAINTNQVSYNGVATNNCGKAMTAGSYVDTTAKIGCAGQSGYDTDIQALAVPWNAGTGRSFSGVSTGFCEICRDGVPVDWPAFTINIKVEAYGRASGTLYTTSNPPSKILGMRNDPNYEIVCP